MRLVPLALAVASVCVRPGAADAAPPAAEIAQEIARGEHAGFESFLMTVGGETVARYVAPGLARKLPDLRSATKSITALLIGIAIDRGEIPSVKTRVADLLPAHRQNLRKDARKEALTIEDLLTMRSGLACDDWDPKSPGHEDKMYEERDWLAFWASQPMAHSPGERFSYCTGNVVALGEILAAATGVSVDRYAAEHLFGPLGIRRAEWQRWNRNRGVDTGGHLRLAPEDFLRIGELVLARGMYGQRRIVSAAWIEAMTRPHVAIPDPPHHYGYLWWVDRTKNPALPATEIWWAQGNGGTLLIVMPGVDSVLAITGTRFNRRDALEPMFWLRDRLLPALKTVR